MYSYRDIYKRLEFEKIIGEKLLKAFDLYNDFFYKKFVNVKFDKNLYDKLKEERKNGTISNENKKIFKSLKYRKLSNYLKNRKEMIINFIINHPKYEKKPVKKIILIKREISKTIYKNIFDNAGGQRRIIYNFDELENTLYERYCDNVQTIVLEQLSIFEQINIFLQADIFIGQHGAGLTNIFFGKKYISIIEISPILNINNNWFKNLTNEYNYDYHKVKQNSMTNEQWIKHKAKYNLDIEDIGQNKNVNKFIEDSGSVNVREITNILDRIIQKY